MVRVNIYFCRFKDLFKSKWGFIVDCAIKRGNEKLKKIIVFITLKCMNQRGDKSSCGDSAAKLAHETGVKRRGKWPATDSLSGTIVEWVRVAKGRRASQFCNWSECFQNEYLSDPVLKEDEFFVIIEKSGRHLDLLCKWTDWFQNWYQRVHMWSPNTNLWMPNC